MTESPRFAVSTTRHRFTARKVQVVAVYRPVPTIARITFTGDDMHDFTATGPGDHVKAFFPNPVTGELLAPTAVGPNEDGINRPDGQTFPRDFTPLNIRETSDGICFDLDFVLHENPGPASAWAEQATIGDSIVVAGPRGSRNIPEGIEGLVCLADPTALPAVVRWIVGLPDVSEIEVIADVDPASIEWVEDYLRISTGRDVLVREPLGGLTQAMLDSAVGAGTYVFAAGEANSLIPVRRAIRTELGLPREQYTVSGYWRRGEANFDHHGPLDPNEPEAGE